MSDGGAQVFVAAGAGVVELASFGVGRIILWFTAAWLTLTALSNHDQFSGVFLFIAAFLALAALVGGFFAARRKRAERASLRAALTLIGVVFVSLGAGLWLAFRKKRSEEPAPPSEAEIDELLR